MLSAKLGYFRAVASPAAAYIAAVEAADGQAMEPAASAAVAAFVDGLIADGVWSGISNACLLCGARTLGGALVPLRGPSPTNFNFVSGDYDRKTGLKGDAATKYLQITQVPTTLNDFSQSVYVAELPSALTATATRALIGWGLSEAGRTLIQYSRNGIGAQSTSFFNRASSSLSSGSASGVPVVGLYAHNRWTSSSVATRRASTTGSTSSATANSGALSTHHVFATRLSSNAASNPSDPRISWFHCGASMLTAGDGLTLLNTRLTTLMSALAAAIP